MKLLEMLCVGFFDFFLARQNGIRTGALLFSGGIRSQDETLRLTSRVLAASALLGRVLQTKLFLALDLHHLCVVHGDFDGTKRRSRNAL